MGELLITLGVLVLLLVVWLLWWTDRSGMAAARGGVARLEAQWGAQWASGASPGAGSGSGAGSGVDLGAAADVRQPPEGTAFAVLRIPALGTGWQQPVLQGTVAGDLRKGVGHYARTAMPGVVGNFAVAGHRTTWGHPFGEIDRLRTGDPIVVETKDGWFVYRVTGHQIVAPGDRSVLAAVPGHPAAVPSTAELTLTTCHPKYSARQRWIVHAELETTRARSAGPPAELRGRDRA